MNRHLALPLIALVFCAVLANSSHALTIYRIGGTELPPPERAAPFDFVQLEWTDIDAELHDSTLLTEIGTALAPQQLDPTVQSTSLLTEVEVLPRAFTPNGDGVNDQTQFAFKVVRVGDDSPAEVEVFDLAGRRVRRLVEQRALSTGAYAIGWDGKDDAGAVVPPGVYYARLRIDTDTEGADISDGQVLKTIAVAY